MIELRGVRKRFGEQVVLDGVDFSVQEGETVALLDDGWKWERQGAHATLAPGKKATLAIITKPLAENALTFDAKSYDQHRQRTVAPGRRRSSRRDRAPGRARAP